MTAYDKRTLPASHRTLALFLVALAICILCAPGQVRAAGADTVVLPSVERFANPSFETIHDGATYPEGHRANVKIRDRVSIINDSRQAFHGNICLMVDNPTDAWAWLGADSIKQQPLHGQAKVTVWLKGSGSFGLQMVYHGKDPLGSAVAPIFKVNSKVWKQYSWDVSIPKTREKNGKAQPLTRIAPLYRVKGKIYIDKMSFVKKADQSQIKSRAFLASADMRRPLITIPKLKRKPKIDGKISDMEWGHASMTTGFHVLGESAYSDRQTNVQLGYDNDYLYIAMESMRGRVARKDKVARQKLWSQQHGAYEIWAESPKHGYVQILVTEFGGIIAHSKDSTVSAESAKLDFKCQTKDSGEMQGGVLTFGKMIFTAELRIPFKTLGMDSPKVGDGLRINFASDMAVDKGKKRMAVDWTTWSPLGAFAKTEDYGKIVFGASDLAVRIKSVGDLNNAGLAFSGEVKNGKGRQLGVMGRVRSRGKGRARTLFSKYADLGGKDDGSFSAETSLGVKRKEELLFQAHIGDLKNQSVLAALSIPFALKPSFSIDVVADYANKKLHVGLDVSKFNVLPPSYVAELVVTDKASEQTYAKTQINASRRQAMPIVTLNLSEVNKGKPGNYVVQCFLFADAKDIGNRDKAIAATTDYLEVPDLKQFVWLNNKLGITDKAPSPWKPVAVNGSVVKITQREYALAGSGLPAQVTTLGEKMFARSPELRAVVDGKQLKWAFSKVKQIKTTDAAVTWAVEGRGGPLTLKGTVRVEFDGFALWSIQVASKAKATINRLWLAFPYPKNRSMYARGAQFLTQFGGKHYSCLYKYKPGTKTKIIVPAHTPVSLNGRWPWPEKFMNNIWIGDDSRGFSLMIESDEFMFGGRYVEIDQKGAENILRYHFISKDVTISPATGAFSYEVAYQATPVKPRPIDPKLWHTDSCSADRKLKGFKERINNSLLCYWALDPLCSPTLARKYAPAATLRRIYGPGPKLTPYFGLNFVSHKVPEWPYFKEVWSTHPRRGCVFPNGKAGYASTRSSFADYMVWTAKEVHDKLGFDGIYCDVSQPIGSSNPFHGSGYERNGKRYQTANIFALRETFKRIYNVYKSDGRQGSIYLHQTGLPATIGFADATIEGESWLAESTRVYSRLTPDIFRLKDMRIQYGTPYAWYTGFNYLYRAQKVLGKGNRIEAPEILAITLPYRVLPAISDKAMYPVWDVLDPWWPTAKFVPYWSEKKIISSGTKDVYASLLVKASEKKALILCGSRSKENKDVSLQIDMAKLWGKGGQKVYVKTVLGGGQPKLNGNNVQFSLSSKNFALIEVGVVGAK
jgi:Glycoside hydrolase 123, N-terminal domain